MTYASDPTRYKKLEKFEMHLEGGYAPPGSGKTKDVETLFSMTHANLERRLRDMKSEEVATLPPLLQEKIIRIQKAAHQGDIDALTSELMQYVGWNLKPIGGSSGGLPPHTLAEPKPNLAPEVRDVVIAMRDKVVISDDFAHRYITGPHLDLITDFMQPMGIDICINSGPSRAYWAIGQGIRGAGLGDDWPADMKKLLMIPPEQVYRKDFATTPDGKALMSTKFRELATRTMSSADPNRQAAILTHANIWRVNLFNDLAADDPSKSGFARGWNGRAVDLMKWMRENQPDWQVAPEILKGVAAQTNLPVTYDVLLSMPPSTVLPTPQPRIGEEGALLAKSNQDSAIAGALYNFATQRGQQPGDLANALFEDRNSDRDPKHHTPQKFPATPDTAREPVAVRYLQMLGHRGIQMQVPGYGIISYDIDEHNRFVRFNRPLPENMLPVSDGIAPNNPFPGQHSVVWKTNVVDANGDIVIDQKTGKPQTVAHALPLITDVSSRIYNVDSSWWDAVSVRAPGYGAKDARADAEAALHPSKDTWTRLNDIVKAGFTNVNQWAWDNYVNSQSNTPIPTGEHDPKLYLTTDPNFTYERLMVAGPDGELLLGDPHAPKPPTIPPAAPMPASPPVPTPGPVVADAGPIKQRPDTTPPPPSTRPAPPPRQAKVPGHAGDGATPHHGDWYIQVGALPTREAALAIARKAQSFSPDLQSIHPTFQPVGSLYRARFEHLSEAEAEQIGRLLEAHGIPSLIHSMAPQQVAEAGDPMANFINKSNKGLGKPHRPPQTVRD